MAQAPHLPTEKDRKQVEMLSGLGMPQEQIAALVGVSEPTLRKHYPDEIRRGMAQANANVAKSLYRAATDWMQPPSADGRFKPPPLSREAVTASIFWLKARAGWRDTQQVELSGRDGAPIQTEQVDSAKDRIARRIARMAAGLPLLPASTEADVAETEAAEDRDQ